MKQSSHCITFILLVISMFTSTAWASQNITPPSQKDAEIGTAQTHDALRALKATMEQALNTGNIDILLENVTGDVVFTTMNDDVVRGKKGIRDYFKTMMKGPDRRVNKVTSRFDVDDLSILYGDDTAIAFGSTNDQYTLADGTEFSIQARWSTTIVLQNGRWLIAAFHYSANIFNNPILSAQRWLMISISIGLILIVAGTAFFVGKHSGRRAP